MNPARTILRLLTFQLSREEMLQFDRKHFIVALIGTWIAGMGRYWDDPDASLLQHLGMGSVIYIFVLAAILWLIVKPFRIPDWSYFTVLTFVGLTSFPAILYAIPVERFYGMSTANSINAWFLLVVAAWRLALLYYFLKRFTELSSGNIYTITLLPICLIISVLTMLNLHRAVFDIMNGIRNHSPHESSYGILVFLTGISMLLIIPIILAYVYCIFIRKKELKNLKE